MIDLLIVDDEPVIRNGIRTSIDWEYYDLRVVGEANNGREALEMSLELKPKIVITDVRMPIMDGLEFSKLLKNHMPDTRIIILSGYEDFTYAKEAIHLGICEYLLKPVGAEELVNLVVKLKKELIIAEQKKAAQDTSIYMISDENRKYKGIIDVAIKYIKENYHKDISLDDICAVVCVTPNYFSRIFKEETGKNFTQWLNEFRIEKAKFLLKDVRKKTYEVAIRIGYNDYKYFSYNFKKYAGCSPKEYRERISL